MERERARGVRERVSRREAGEQEREREGWGEREGEERLRKEK